MPTKKSEIIKNLSKNYPNFLKKDIVKLVDIFFLELKNSLKRHERVELRDVFSIEPKLRKARYANPTAKKGSANTVKAKDAGPGPDFDLDKTRWGNK